MLAVAAAALLSPSPAAAALPPAAAVPLLSGQAAAGASPLAEQLPAAEGGAQAQAATAGGEAVAATAAAYDDFDLELDEAPSGFPDPWEDSNRSLLALNRTLDRWVFEPVTRVYRNTVPDPVRAAVRRAFLNVGSVPILLNDLLQMNIGCAEVTTVRLIVNSGLGLGGLFDPSAAMGLPRHNTDFGQTLEKAGIGSGPYLMLPVFGPSTARDGFGTVVDGVFNPALWVLGPAEQLTYGGGVGLAARDAHYEALEALEESSVDYYAALRNGYYQARVGQLGESSACDCAPGRSGPSRSRANWRSRRTGLLPSR